MNKDKILLVDDEEEFTKVLAERMETRGLDVDTVASGAEALEQARDKPYDAVILDMAMPEMDGIETLKRLLDENPDLQVIFLTGKATLQKGIEAVKLGALDFLEKPVKLETLMERIKEAKSNKIILVEKKNEEKIRGILGTKGW
jgi:DNA-binding NtrC family response regulator